MYNNERLQRIRILKDKQQFNSIVVEGVTKKFYSMFKARGSKDYVKNKVAKNLRRRIAKSFIKSGSVYKSLIINKTHKSISSGCKDDLLEDKVEVNLFTEGNTYDLDEKHYELNKKLLEDHFLGKKVKSSISSPIYKLKNKVLSSIIKTKHSDNSLCLDNTRKKDKEIRFNNSVIKNILANSKPIEKDISGNITVLLNYLKKNYKSIRYSDSKETHKKYSLPPIKSAKECIFNIHDTGPYNSINSRRHPTKHFRIYSLLNIKKPCADLISLRKN